MSVQPVPTELRHLVQSISVETGTDAPVTVVPDTATGLVFCDGGGVAVTGPRTRAGYHFGGPARRVVVRLQPGRAQLLLGRPVGELVDRVVPLHEENGELSEMLLARLAKRSAREVARSDLAHRAATVLAGDTTVGDAARQLHVSERQLRTIFTDAIGLSPKHFARLDRLRAVLARAGRGSWSDLAVAAGFYDQAHLTVEFRTIMGVPPAAFVSGQLPPATPCTGSVSA
ncbi:helix-turn-helix domain-containing protein [Actinophytocola sp.]|uniref:helix-turn-helix domain-containing protein n=1 Tax=Actinophytocola sp. TaxID=1872138 RepID=UPI002ED30345